MRKFDQTNHLHSSLLKIETVLAAALLGLLITVSVAFAQTAERNTYVRYVRTGMEQLKAGNYQEARFSFEEAIRYYDADSAAHLGLGMVCLHLGDDRNAERELSRAMEINPREAATYQLLGELYYRKDDLETAASYWQKAVDFNPSDTSLAARLERIRKEHRTEKDFNRDVTGHFLIKYEGREKVEAGRIVSRILEDAYGEVGRALSYYPDHEIQVILYSSEQFREVTDAPGWSGGVYDGKIRIPVGGVEKETPGLRRILVHEYAHSVVRAMTPRCPTWLNEGLAQYFEGREIDAQRLAMLKQLAREDKLPALASLEGPFNGLGPQQAALAYLFSLSTVRYLVDSFGMYRVKAVLENLSAGGDTGRAIDSSIMLSYEEFERGWKRSLE
jgi:tetratricopeptide (TPR) repeat protein